MIGSLRGAPRRVLRRSGLGLGILLTLSAAGTLRAADVFWQGDDAGDPTNWAVDANWDIGTIPGVADNPIIENGLPATVSTDVGLVNDVHVRGGSRLNVVAGGVVAPNILAIGDIAGSSGEFVQSGGKVDAFLGVQIGVAGGAGLGRLTGGQLLYNSPEGFGQNAQFLVGSDGEGTFNLEGGELRQVTGNPDDGASWNYIGRGAGEATFNLTGGTASFNSRTHIGVDAAPATVNQSGGLFEVRNHELIISDNVTGGAQSVYNMTGGELKVLGRDAGGTLIRDIQVGHWVGSNGRLNVSGGRIETRDINLGNYRSSQGFMEITDNADIQVNGWMRVGNGESEFVGQGLQDTARGHVSQTGGKLNIAGRLLVGDKRTSEGVYDMSGGEIHAGDWSFIGGVGEGYGDNGTPGNLADDRLAGAGKGTFNLSGTGLLNIRNRFHVGGENASQGFLNQTGGTLYVEAIRDGGGNITNAPDMLIGDGRKSYGEYNLNAGTATIDRDLLVGHWGNTEGHLNQSGGTLSVGQNMFVGAGTDTDVNDIGNDRIAGTADDDFNSPNYGFVNLTGGTLTVANDLVLGDGPTANGQVDVQGGAMSLGNNLVLGRNGHGLFTQIGGTFTIDDNMIIGENATGDGNFTLDGGVLDMTGGAMSFGAGAAQFNFEGGTLKDAGTINFSLVNNGGTLAPGASPGTTTINGDYTVTSVNASYQVELAGLAQGTEYDFLNVTGLTSLNGELEVLLAGGGAVLGDTNADGEVDLDDLNNVRNNFGGNGLGDTNGDNIVDLNDLNNVRNNFGAVGSGFVPNIGDSFTILSSAGGVAGTFASLSLPTLPAGRAWDLAYLANDVRLSVLAAPVPVPEPTTLGLACVLMLGAGWWVRRQKRG